MSRKYKSRPMNPITRDMIQRCRECDVYKICTIPIAKIETSEYCFANNFKENENEGT